MRSLNLLTDKIINLGNYKLQYFLVTVFLYGNIAIIIVIFDVIRLLSKDQLL